MAGSGSSFGYFLTWSRYMAAKVKEVVALHGKSYVDGKMDQREMYKTIRSHLLRRATFMTGVKGEAMAPTFNTGMDGKVGETLLIRSLYEPSIRSVWVDDVVLLRHPNDSKQSLVRRVAALEGDEMLSNDPEDKPFRIEPNSCWVLADNQETKPPEVEDSRTFGPLALRNIVGRAIYSMTSPSDHGVVRNSDQAMAADAPVLAFELDLEEMGDRAGKNG
ncbi:Mitochondrial inner membrane protease subunit IMP2 [Klebsormidium nitens]|uniref:Mitochondrial inner membrane protease subunit IMP2 n=1 Tax=Klebsormidium nitens TaxID=105231 RepID=A0A1Y1HTN7_KLENI|nr:Mitochondrial inner membrane protease subunit IMP2 [Klebsormidium nitens]|eukprot:GAQ81493.1 Mitochondrial inner membrane protease subunit IMP2 [Klebsormidium nitens]